MLAEMVIYILLLLFMVRITFMDIKDYHQITVTDSVFIQERKGSPAANFRTQCQLKLSQLL